jgi:hypothetical protein
MQYENPFQSRGVSSAMARLRQQSISNFGEFLRSVISGLPVIKV